MKNLAVCLALVIPIAAGCDKSAQDKEKTYDVKGKVTALDLGKKSVTLDHEDIPGIMPAMEMPFDVADARVLDGLKVGDPVVGKLIVKDGAYLVLELRKR